MSFERPRIAAVPGDLNGIGPELLVKLLAQEGIADRADILVIGDRVAIEEGMRVTGLNPLLRRADRSSLDRDGQGFPWIETAFVTPDDLAYGEVSEVSGTAALRTLDIALDLAMDGTVDGILFAPFNKASLIAAGLGHEDELHYMAARLNTDNYVCELNVLDGLWTSRVTSHIALKDVPARLTGERIDEAIALVHRTLRLSGIDRPRIAVAALNPHGGDSGNFGREEIDVIAPAVERARSQQMNVTGPWPADTIFLKATAGGLDAVVTMYHDQGQIALKLLGFDRGVTVQGGLQIPVTTPAHGTAFDIAGQGVANPGATRAAFDLLVPMALALGRKRRGARAGAFSGNVRA